MTSAADGRRRFKQAEQKCVLIDYKYNYYYFN